MAEQELQERTLSATPKRREEARNRGDVARSRELVSAAVILGAAFLLYAMGEDLFSRMLKVSAFSWSNLITAPMTQQGMIDLLNHTMRDTLIIIVPLIAFFGLVVMFTSVGHYGFLWSSEGLTPDWSRINPLNGLARLFSLTSFVEFIKTLLKFGLIGFVVYKVIEADLPQIVLTTQQSPGTMLFATARMLTRLFFFTGLTMAILGVADYGYQWWDHERKLRMTPQEMKEEMKQTEGNPLIKSRIRAIQREMARKRMMAEVPKATVIITNPTHLAIALLYNSDKMTAPIVVAKGAGFVAQTIREIAEAHGICRVENKPLAQTLYKTVPLGETIPSQLYRAVAEILVYVYQLRTGSRGVRN
jgi:flagellar biosynthetic protein FlhB